MSAARRDAESKLARAQMMIGASAHEFKVRAQAIQTGTDDADHARKAEVAAAVTHYVEQLLNGSMRDVLWLDHARELAKKDRDDALAALGMPKLAEDDG